MVLHGQFFLLGSVSRWKSTRADRGNRGLLSAISVGSCSIIVVVHFPAEVVAERLGQNRRRVRLRHDYMMLEALFADVVQDFLQVRHFGHGAVAEGFEFVVREFAFADVATDPALGIGGGDAAVSQRTGRRAPIERAIGILHAENTAEDRRVSDLDVRQKALGPIAAVEEDALVVVVRVTDLSRPRGVEVEWLQM